MKVLDFALWMIVSLCWLLQVDDKLQVSNQTLLKHILSLALFINHSTKSCVPSLSL